MPSLILLQANEAVCLVEVDGAPVLSPPAGLDIDMCGTENLGVLGKVRSWKAVRCDTIPTLTNVLKRNIRCAECDDFVFRLGC